MKKPFDIGNSIVSASISEEGKLITLNSGHKKQGFIKLAPVKSFSNDDWYSPEKVRKYRNSFLTEDTADKAIGISFEKEFTFDSTLSTQFKNNTNIIYNKLSHEDLELNTYIFIPPASNMIIFIYDLENYSKNKIETKFMIAGETGIIRASYGQITENGPIPIPKTENVINRLNNNILKLEETGTESCSYFALIGDYKSFEFLNDNERSESPLKIKSSGQIQIGPGKKNSIALVIYLHDEINTIIPDIDLEEVFALKKKTVEYWNSFNVISDNPDWDFIVNRNFAYSFGCCFLKNFGAMITDHQSLPLTWNRDNYYMYKLMEKIYIKTENKDLLNMLKKHIEWLYTWITPSGWGRSHLVTGKIKDVVFQFDQQCYPIIELYDILGITELEPELLNSCLEKLDMICELLCSKKGKDVFLFETDENPADDPVLYPYHFSTQVLAWRTFSVLEELNKKYSFSSKDFNGIANIIRENIFRYMIGEADNKKLFCYTADAKGNFEFYHDANDLPTALAPLWGFIDVDNEIYQNTLGWAFSEKNRGFYPGEFGGLGSEHAKGHWPLGTSQLLAVALAEMKKNESSGVELFEQTLKKLKNIVMKDGLFSESVFPDSGKVYTRYWFAWPGSTISWLYLLNN